MLLTGATGYLGIHILQELIDSDAKEIFCLVRDKDMDAAEHRLKLLLFYYFENTYDELFGKRIHIVVGDVTNAFMGRIKIYNMLGCIPYELYEEQVEFSPINEVAHAIMLLSSTPKQNCLFHVYNSHSQFLGDVLSEFKNINGEFKFVEQDEYKEVLDLAMTDPEKAKNLSSLLAYQDLAHGKKVADVTLTNTYTTQVLHRLGFKWSATTWDYIDKMLEAISGRGYFD